MAKFKQQTAKLKPGPLDYVAGGKNKKDAEGKDHLPVVYLHGRGGLVTSEAHDLLAADRRLYMPITPGLDGTPFLDGVDTMPALADLVADFIKKRLGGKCDLVGHSFGGWLAAWVAVRHPELVDLLVLAAPAGLRPDAKAGETPPSPAEHLRLAYAHPERVPPSDRAPETANANREAVKHYHKGVAMDAALAARLSEIAAPTLILYGTEERMIPIETCRILSDAIPRHFLIYMHDAGHGLHVDQPERFARVVGDFFDRGEAFIVPRAAAE